jgi:hypothetical protein
MIIFAKPDRAYQAHADHPLTCLNPDYWFDVAQIQIELDKSGMPSETWIKGENTSWFNIKFCQFRETK